MLKKKINYYYLLIIKISFLLGHKTLSTLAWNITKCREK